MPELPEVETVRAGLAEVVAGAKVTKVQIHDVRSCLLYTSPSPRDQRGSRMPSSA